MHVVCPHCLATNRIPDERLGDAPTCGQCGAPLLDGKPVSLTDANFEAVVTKTELPILVDFWAPWCGPCRMMAPQFEQAAEQVRGRALFVKVDTDENPKTSLRYRIRSIPTLALLRGGQEVNRTAGAMSAKDLLRWAGL